MERPSFQIFAGFLTDEKCILFASVVEKEILLLTHCHQEEAYGHCKTSHGHQKEDFGQYKTTHCHQEENQTAERREEESEKEF
eukprot:COSAG05_NODE_2194_length_3418_cov_6.232901_1_plen_82_part_10